MDNLNIVLPMAGKGQRFKDKGIYDPKPLIDVAGIPMVKRAAMSLSFFDKIKPSNIICIVRNDDVKKFDIKRKLRQIFGNGIHVLVDQNPIGAATTVLVAKSLINNTNQLIVMDCDVSFHSSEYESKILMNDRNTDGLIPVFPCEGNKWSFSEFGSDKKIKTIAEKKRISNYANIGFYYFSNGYDFIENTERLLNKKVTAFGEYYISLVMNEMIQNGKSIYAAIADNFKNMGTPDDLNIFLENLNR
jgi:dTDP-glucose pyrophosphorylase